MLGLVVVVNNFPESLAAKRMLLFALLSLMNSSGAACPMLEASSVSHSSLHTEQFLEGEFRRFLSARDHV